MQGQTPASATPALGQLLKASKSVWKAKGTYRGTKLSQAVSNFFCGDDGSEWMPIANGFAHCHYVRDHSYVQKKKRKNSYRIMQWSEIRKSSVKLCKKHLV